MSITYKLDCDIDSGWFIMRKDTTRIYSYDKPIIHYLHENGSWYSEFDAVDSRWGGLWPTSYAAKNAFLRMKINASLEEPDRNKISPSYVVLADDDTYGSPNFVGHEKRKELTFCLGRTDLGWYISGTGFPVKETQYLAWSGHFTGSAIGAYYATKQDVMSVFRRVRPNNKVENEDAQELKIRSSYAATPEQILPPTPEVMQDGYNRYVIRSVAPNGNIKYFDGKHWSSVEQPYKTQEELLKDFRQIEPTVEIKGYGYDPSLDKFRKGNTFMCQGVISIYNSINGHYHWGVGSHTDLIRKIYPDAKNTAGDKLVRIEARISDGPGELSVEGGTADKFQIEEFKNKMVAQAGTVDLLLAYMEKHGQWDNAFMNIFADNTDFYYNVYEKDAERRKKTEEIYSVQNNNTLSVALNAAFGPISERSKAAHEAAKTAYFTKLAEKLRAATFTTQAEYNDFHAKVIGKVSEDLKVIAEVNRLELDANNALARFEITKKHYESPDDKEKTLMRLRMEEMKIVTKLMRDYIDKKPEKLRAVWKATLKTGK